MIVFVYGTIYSSIRHYHDFIYVWNYIYYQLKNIGYAKILFEG